MDDVHELRAGVLRLAVRADLGCSMAGFWHGSEPLLRSTEPGDLNTARASACYPLVPYSNRVAYRRFRWQGQDYTTEQNFDTNPHSVHGVGWLRPWQKLSGDAARAVFRYAHTPDAHWPFAFNVTQSFDLTPHRLEVRLVITNTDARTQPVGLGWHPYFPKRADSRIEAPVQHCWASDAAGLPTHRAPQAPIDAHVAQLAFDHCFDGWSGQACVRDEKFELRIASSLDRLVVYTPADKPYFCVEPVSHVSNAINMPDPIAQGLRSLEAGASFEASMTLGVTAR